MADLNALYDLLEQSTLYSGTRRMYGYAKSNPNEAPIVEAYWRRGGQRPSSASKFALFLLDVADGLRGAPPATTVVYGKGTYGGG